MVNQLSNNPLFVFALSSLRQKQDSTAENDPLQGPAANGNVETARHHRAVLELVGCDEVQYCIVGRVINI